jgi:hypothetical protein
MSVAAMILMTAEATALAARLFEAQKSSSPLRGVEQNGSESRAIFVLEHLKIKLQQTT